MINLEFEYNIGISKQLCNTTLSCIWDDNIGISYHITLREGEGRGLNQYLKTSKFWKYWNKTSMRDFQSSWNNNNNSYYYSHLPKNLNRHLKGKTWCDVHNRFFNFSRAIKNHRNLLGIIYIPTGNEIDLIHNIMYASMPQAKHRPEKRTTYLGQLKKKFIHFKLQYTIWEIMSILKVIISLKERVIWSSYCQLLSFAFTWRCRYVLFLPTY